MSDNIETLHPTAAFLEGSEYPGEEYCILILYKKGLYTTGYNANNKFYTHTQLEVEPDYWAYSPF